MLNLCISRVNKWTKFLGWPAEYICSKFLCGYNWPMLMPTHGKLQGFVTSNFILL